MNNYPVRLHFGVTARFSQFNEKEKLSMQETDWHRADIVAALHKRGLSLSQLSVAAGLSASTLRNALRAPYPRAEQIIAEAIGVPAHEIWPSRYPNKMRKPNS